MDIKTKILSALHNQELPGLDIAKAVGVDVTRLYPLLHDLEKEGFIQSRWSQKRFTERNGARKRYYSLSRKGVASISEVVMTMDNLKPAM